MLYNETPPAEETLAGMKTQAIPREQLHGIPHADVQRVERYAVKSKEMSQTINMVYRHAKFDLMRLLMRNLSDDDRRTLYAEAKQAVELWMKGHRENELRITFRQTKSLLGDVIASSLVYSLSKPKRS